MIQQPASREIKVVLLGDAGVGKSSILLRFVEDKFNPGQEATLGAAFQSQIITHKGNQYKFQVWDTAGQEKYRSLTPLYYRDAQAACVIFDITNKPSFEILKNWIDELKQRGPGNIITAIIGNKEDLIDQEQVTYEEASEYAKELGALFKYTSAKLGKGIQEIFIQIADQIYEQDQKNKLKKQKENDIDQSFVQKLQHQEKKDKKKGCC